MADPNIISTTSITGTTKVVTSIITTGSGSTLVDTVSSGYVYKLNSVVIANKTASAATISVAIVRSATNYYLVNTVSVPGYSSLVVVNKDMQIYLQENDSLIGIAGTSSALDGVASYEAIT